MTSFASPPRELTREAALGLTLGSPRVAIGLVVLAAFSGLFWAFVWRSEVITKLEFRGQTRAAIATVTNSEETSMAETRRARIWALSYQYDLASGAAVRGTSYGPQSSLEPGDSVAVDVLVADPTKSRARGMRRRPYGLAPALFVPVGIAGLALVVWGLASGRREVRLLRHGVAARAELLGKRPTIQRFNGKRVFTLRLGFETEPRPAVAAADYRTSPVPRRERHEFAVRTHEPEALEGASSSVIFHDAARPGDAIALALVDAFVTPRGAVHTSRSLVYSYAPAIAFVAANVASRVAFAS